MINEQHKKFMHEALCEAQKSADKGEVPIGAVMIHRHNIIAKAHNTCEADNNPLSHAELKAIGQTARHQNNWRLTDCDLYVTLEPCPMCLGALFQARVRHIYYGCPDHKRTAHSFFPTLEGKKKASDNNHQINITGGILEQECANLLKGFFKTKRGA